jgi:hypothetical protein
MRRVFPRYTTSIVLIAFMALCQQQGHAQGWFDLVGTYAFTLTETCVHQLSASCPTCSPATSVPGFNSSFHLVDPKGAETYSGASNGLLIFDGNGGASIQQGLATNVMNASDRLVQPTITPIPLGFGLGPALPFTCTGTYSQQSGKGPTSTVTVPLVCNAVIAMPNALGTSGFQSSFSFQGVIPQSTETLTLTDIGNTIQPVTIFFPGNPSLVQQRVCTRSATLTLLSREPLQPPAK